MKKILIGLVLLLLLSSCSVIESSISKKVAGTVAAYTPIPTSTSFPTYTPYPTATAVPTIAITRVVVQTPTPHYSDDYCKPMTQMDYTDNPSAILMLQAYVSTLPGIQTVSYTINEKLYSNSLSQLVHVTYVAEEDGQVYSKRYIVFLNEFSWFEGVFSIDGQCWVDGPHYE